MSPPVEHANASICSRTKQNDSVVLIIYTFLLSFTPSEAYLVPYLARVKSFSNKEIGVDIFPCGVYATFIFTLLAAPVCRFLSHRGVIIMGTLSGLVCYVILYYAESLFMMQVGQAFYGLAMASQLVFSSYIFVIFSEADFPALTSYTQASALVAFLLAAELGQLLVDRGVSLEVLLEITLIFSTITSLVSFFLPRHVPDSLELLLSLEPDRGRQGIKEIIIETWKGENLRLFSIWWVLGTAGFSMIFNYGMNLFEEIDSTINTFGHITAASQGAGSLGALAGVLLASLADKTGGLLYVLGTVVSGLLCIVMAWSNTLWVAYPAFVTTIGIKQLLLCLIYVQCAKSLSNREFVLLFSFNAVGALLAQSALQGVVELLQLSMKHQYYAYGCYCLALSAVFWMLCNKFLESQRTLITSNEN